MDLNVLIAILLVIAIGLLLVDKIQFTYGKRFPVDRVKCFGCNWEGVVKQIVIDERGVAICPSCGNDNELHYLIVEVDKKEREG